MSNASKGLEYIDTFRIWRGILSRCAPNGRYTRIGITLCPQWRNSFELFLEEVGPRPSPQHSIDRIDGTRGYEPGNVRWVTPDIQQENRIYAATVELNGQTHRLVDLAKRCAINPSTANARLKRGWSVEEAFGIVGRPWNGRSKTEPSDRQAQVISAIREFTATYGYPPSIRELCALLGVGSTNAVKTLLDVLRRKKLVDWIDGKSRTIRLTAPPPLAAVPKAS